MRIHGSVTALSWIPSEAITGIAKLPFGAGVARYDMPPPDSIGADGSQLAALRDSDRFRFANHLSAWIEVADDGTITGADYDGGGLIGSTRLSLVTEVSVAAVALPDQRAQPEYGDGWVRFLQTAGGRTGVPAPRTVRRPPFVQYHAPIAWSTLELTIRTTGGVNGSLVGASPFPRHWVYDSEGVLTAKSGLIDFKRWSQDAFGDHTPWGDLDSPALVTAVGSALERELSRTLMSGRKLVIRKVRKGEIIVAQGNRDRHLFVLLDGVVSVAVDGRELCELGPGAVLGERSILEGGARTATLRAVTLCKVAVATGADVDRIVLARLSIGHRREEMW